MQTKAETIIVQAPINSYPDSRIFENLAPKSKCILKQISDLKPFHFYILSMQLLKLQIFSLKHQTTVKPNKISNNSLDSLCDNILFRVFFLSMCMKKIGLYFSFWFCP